MQGLSPQRRRYTEIIEPRPTKFIASWGLWWRWAQKNAGSLEELELSILRGKVCLRNCRFLFVICFSFSVILTTRAPVADADPFRRVTRGAGESFVGEPENLFGVVPCEGKGMQTWDL